MDKLYYYTNVETMKYILQDANIFATNLLYMNDAEEYFNGLKELRNIINQKCTGSKKPLTEALQRQKLAQEVTSYSISFSTENDLLSQWSMYAGESGVSLGLEFTGNERYDGYSENDTKDTRKRISDLEIRPRRVHYCTKAAMTDYQYNKTKKEIWKAIEENALPVTVKDIRANAEYIWTEMTPYVKRYEFSAEEEYRLVFDWANIREKLRIDYRIDRHVLKPYLDIECEGGWPIREIKVGPGFNQNVVFKSILHFLRHGRIKVSPLPANDYVDVCEKYFKECKVLSSNAEIDIFNSRRNELYKDDVEKRYETYLTIKREIMELLDKADTRFDKLINSELSKDGIILTKSGIPYIF